MAIGDSFTEGLNDPDPGGGFRGWADLAAGAMAAQHPGFRYANLAIRGKLLGQVVADQVPRAVELAPDLVSLAAGGNDILRGADVDALAAVFEPAVAKLQAAGCRVLIFTGFDPRMFPVIRLLRGRIAAYNMHLRGIADSCGCDLVDLWSMPALKDIRAWSPDRLHLSTEGHRQVARRACEVLGIPAAEDWRVPLPPAPRPVGPPRRSQWLAARRQDARWARLYAAPWVRRRLGGTSSGDGVPPKRPDLLPVLAGQAGQDLLEPVQRGGDPGREHGSGEFSAACLPSPGRLNPVPSAGSPRLGSPRLAGWIFGWTGRR